MRLLFGLSVTLYLGWEKTSRDLFFAHPVSFVPGIVCTVKAAGDLGCGYKKVRGTYMLYRQEVYDLLCQALRRPSGTIKAFGMLECQ